MIKLYNSDYNFISLLDDCKDICITETLNAGTKSLRFLVPCNDYNLSIIQEENYIEMKDYSYVIKEVNLEDNNFIRVYCNPNVEELIGNIFFIFDCFEINPELAYQYSIQGTNWQVKYLSNNKTIMTKQTSNINAYTAIKEIAEELKQELWFDTKQKIVYVYDRIGADLGAYYSNELNLKLLTKQSNTYDYATVLYPIGKDGLTISIVNNNKDYLENFSYTNKYIQKIWINEDYDRAETLKAAAVEYLNNIAVPRASYRLELSQLGNSVSIGDNIMIVDKFKRIKQKQRVVKIVRYPLTPERDIVEISNLQVDFAQTFLSNQHKLEKEINNIKKHFSQIK